MKRSSVIESCITATRGVARTVVALLGSRPSLDMFGTAIVQGIRHVRAWEWRRFYYNQGLSRTAAEAATAALLAAREAGLDPDTDEFGFAALMAQHITDGETDAVPGSDRWTRRAHWMLINMHHLLMRVGIAQEDASAVVADALNAAFQQHESFAQICTSLDDTRMDRVRNVIAQRIDAIRAKQN